MDIDDGYEAEEELKLRQGAALYPLGRALRTTFDADHHDTLSGDVTGLMLELTRIPFEPARSFARDAPVPATAAIAAGAGAATTHAPMIRSSGLLDKLRGLLAR